MACEQLWSTAKQSLIIAELLTALKIEKHGKV
jgi:hypothetical protein